MPGSWRRRRPPAPAGRTSPSAPCSAASTTPFSPPACCSSSASYWRSSSGGRGRPAVRARECLHLVLTLPPDKWYNRNRQILSKALSGGGRVEIFFLVRRGFRQKNQRGEDHADLSRRGMALDFGQQRADGPLVRRRDPGVRNRQGAAVRRADRLHAV